MLVGMLLMNVMRDWSFKTRRIRSKQLKAFWGGLSTASAHHVRLSLLPMLSLQPIQKTYVLWASNCVACKQSRAINSQNKGSSFLKSHHDHLRGSMLLHACCNFPRPRLVGPKQNPTLPFWYPTPLQSLTQPEMAGKAHCYS